MPVIGIGIPTRFRALVELISSRPKKWPGHRWNGPGPAPKGDTFGSAPLFRGRRTAPARDATTRRSSEFGPGLGSRARRLECRSTAAPPTFEDADTEYDEGLKVAIRQAVELGITSIERGPEWKPPAPTELAIQAQRAARTGVSLDAVLRRYALGDRIVGEFIVEEGDRFPGHVVGQMMKSRGPLVDALMEKLIAGDPRRRHGRTGLRVRVLAPGCDRGRHFAGTVIDFPGPEQLDPAVWAPVCRVAVSGLSAELDLRAREGARPLFAKPLTGAVYLHRSAGRFPNLVAAIRGTLTFDLHGRLSFADGRVRVAMNPIPDLPDSRLNVTVSAGRRGTLINNRDLCLRPEWQGGGPQPEARGAVFRPAEASPPMTNGGRTDQRSQPIATS
jgi:hypothetical protein